MSEQTGIEWATHTASPWFGCSKVSPGCTHCYAEELTLRNKWAGWGDNSPRVRSKGFWKDAYKYDRLAKQAHENWASVPMSIDPSPEPERPRMFTSLMDLLDPKAQIGWFTDFLKVVFDCQNLDWLLLTKRPENFHRHIAAALHYAVFNASKYMDPPGFMDWLEDWGQRTPPSNVWFGVTVENQEMAEKRIPELLKIPAKVRWLSVEPLLELVQLTRVCGLSFNRNPDHSLARTDGAGIDWVVVGGESGSKRRDCGVFAISAVASQCQVAGVPVFVKQDCAFKPGQQGRIPADIWKLKQYPK